MRAGNAASLAVRAAVPVLACLLAAGRPAAGQTPPSACAADSLYLMSPGQVGLTLQQQGRLGIVASWRTLDILDATCFSLDDTLGLGFGVTAAGGFGDRVDRVLKFTTADSGIIGAAQSNPLVFNWLNEGPTTNGSLAGILNLANNGGIWRYSNAQQAWTQVNDGLPMSWRQVNVLALDQGPDGTLVAGLGKGETLDTDVVGLFVNADGTWTQIAPDIFNAGNRITHVRVSPETSARFLVGTSRNGLYVTADGGQTFTRWTTQLDPGFATMPATFNVGCLDWIGERIFVHVVNFGLFASADDGLSFTRLPIMVPDNLDLEHPALIQPAVNGIAVDPQDPDRLVAALTYHGAYESLDGGATWHDLYGDLVVPDPDGATGVWVNTALAVHLDRVHANWILMMVRQKGLYLSVNGGQNWQLVGADVQPENVAALTRAELVDDTGSPGTVHVFEDGHALLTSTDSGQTWSRFDPQPVLATAMVMVAPAGGGGDLLVGTYGGGIYRPGTPLRLRDTYTTGTSVELRGLDLGLELTFGQDGRLQVDPFDTFRLVCQTFQGWAVWRAPSDDPQNMVLLGLYDRVNPEDCIRGYCGEEDYEVVPQCFAAKRAACFDFATQDTVRFFDGEVYNGFGYYYAVTSFDYGNTGLTTPQNNSNAMIFSPRWQDDPNSPFAGAGNRSFVQVNLAAEPAAAGQEIYAFPNPLRAGAGIPGGEGRTVVFTNLPAGAHVRVFTVAGDDVIDIGPEQMVGGQIYWQTENRDREPVAPGVYLYKVEMPQREDYWGRLVVIR